MPFIRIKHSTQLNFSNHYPINPVLNATSAPLFKADLLTASIRYFYPAMQFGPKSLQRQIQQVSSEAGMFADGQHQ